MTDQELILMLKCCGKEDEAADCENCPGNETGCAGAFLCAADRLEALLAENEHLREVTKKIPKWISVEETPTYADRIRSMTDEELRDFLWTVEFSGIEAAIPNCCNKPCSDPESENPGADACKQCLLDKLQQLCEDSPIGQKG